MDQRGFNAEEATATTSNTTTNQETEPIAYYVSNAAMAEVPIKHEYCVVFQKPDQRAA